MPLKTSSSENEYFAREEAIKLRKLTSQQKKEMSSAERQKLKDLHFMHCPKCGLEMKTIKINDVDIDKCFSCGGLFFDDGELEKVTRRASEFFKSVDNVFKN
ncbi:MAG TPA: zf-TFIIB domain-containing protein [Myxococcota bacterium]|nr:zf-TFIIB domain-containing protein [Myxococcota bacterium]